MLDSNFIEAVVLAASCGIALLLAIKASERARKAEEKLERYRLACAQAERALTVRPEASNTAKWIGDQGEDRPSVSIDRHRAVMSMRRSR